MAVQTGQAATAMECGTISTLARVETCHQGHGLAMNPGVLSAQVPSATASTMDAARPESDEGSKQGQQCKCKACEHITEPNAANAFDLSLPFAAFGSALC